MRAVPPHPAVLAAQQGKAPVCGAAAQRRAAVDGRQPRAALPAVQQAGAAIGCRHQDGAAVGGERQAADVVLGDGRLPGMGMGACMQVKPGKTCAHHQGTHQQHAHAETGSCVHKLMTQGLQELGGSICACMHCSADVHGMLLGPHCRVLGTREH